MKKILIIKFVFSFIIGIIILIAFIRGSNHEVSTLFNKFVPLVDAGTAGKELTTIRSEISNMGIGDVYRPNYQSSIVRLDDTRYVAESSGGFVNYKVDGEFLPINITLIDRGDYWEITKASYNAKIPKNANGLFEFTNLFEGNNHTLKVKPVANNTVGILIGEGAFNDRVVLYKDAFGNGIDLKATVYNTHILREVIINEPLNESKDDLNIDFEFTLPENKSVETKDIGTLKKEKIDSITSKNYTNKSILFGDENPTILFPFRAWYFTNKTKLKNETDEEGVIKEINVTGEVINEIKIPITIFKDDNGKVYFRKTIPVKLLKKEIYPIYTDDDTGLTNGGTFVSSPTNGGAYAWANPTNAATSNNVRADAATSDMFLATEYLNVTNFGFTTSGTIDGVIVKVERMDDWDDEVRDVDVSLLVGSSVIGDNKKNAGGWTTTATVITYGASDDVWNTGVTSSQVNAVGFGMVISAEVYSGGGFNDPAIDHIQIQVYYTADTTPPSFSSNQTNASSTTYNGTDIQINLTITDGTAVDFYTLTHNDTSDGTWANESFVSAGDTSPITMIWNYSIENFSTTGGTMGWRVWANDTTGNVNISDIYTFSIIEIIPPSFSNNQTNASSTTYNGTDVQINLTITDDTAVDYYTLTHNDTIRLCYQETANVSTSCGGLNNGTYSNVTGDINNNNWYDEDWNTMSQNTDGNGGNVTINYTKPSNAVSSSLWQHKRGNATDTLTENLSLSSCWDAYSDKISLFIHDKNSGTEKMRLACWNGTNWEVLRNSSGDFQFYEEAMWWKMPEWTNESFVDGGDTSPITMVWNYSISNFPTSGGTMGWRVWANDTAGNVNVSNIYTFDVNPIVTDTCTCPTLSDWNIDLSDNCVITSDCDVRPYNTICYGTGSLGIYANLYTGDFTCDMKDVYMDTNGVLWVSK